MNLGIHQLLDSRTHVDLREMTILDGTSFLPINLRPNHLSALSAVMGAPFSFIKIIWENCHRISAGFITLNQESDERSIEEHEIPPLVTEGGLI